MLYRKHIHGPDARLVERNRQLDEQYINFCRQSGQPVELGCLQQIVRRSKHCGRPAWLNYCSCFDVLGVVHAQEFGEQAHLGLPSLQGARWASPWPAAASDRSEW
jgi:hypothetical protein